MNIRSPKDYKHLKQRSFTEKVLNNLTSPVLKNDEIERWHVILGIGLLTAVVSIAYSTSVIYMGVDSTASRIAIFPQVLLAIAAFLFAITILSKALSKNGETNG